ncbi:hypothetical protein R1sor_007849 [Riccia sorocarpa]|uniref:DUF4283 domain-containing protein n=1 Tax=Riccia sorocarpa TaxID=122646 RepID=A0ABD3HRX4_9MARC
MEAQKKQHLSEEQLVAALKKISLQKSDNEEPLAPRVSVSKREGFKIIRKQMERGILTYYFEGTPSIGPFRKWVVANWAKKLHVTVETVPESGNRGFLTILKTKEDKETILSHVHANIRGCVVAHLPWSPEMDVIGYSPSLKPMEVALSGVPSWAKPDIPKIFLMLGPVTSLPLESREMVHKDIVATILWDEAKDLPKSLLVCIAGCDFKCEVRKVVHKKTTDDTEDPDQEDTGEDCQKDNAEDNRDMHFAEGDRTLGECSKAAEARTGVNHQLLLQYREMESGSKGGSTSHNRVGFDLNISVEEADSSQLSRTAAVDSRDKNQLILGVTVLQQLEYGVLVGAQSWSHELQQKMPTGPNAVTIEEIETGQDQNAHNDLNCPTRQTVPDLNMEDITWLMRKRESRGETEPIPYNKRRRTNVQRGSRMSEPSLDLMLETPGGLRASRSE